MKLWNAIEQYKVNLTDLGDKAYIYGEVQMPEAIEIIGVANDYGETEVSLSIVGRAAQWWAAFFFSDKQRFSVYIGGKYQRVLPG